jgi:peptidoglycan/LPS O-acetylase OafA/YrhL
MATTQLAIEREASLSARWHLPTHVPELDGVRGVAVLLVMICHSAMWLPHSWLRTVLVEGKIGVDLFFVLSGFLITGILLDTQRDRSALRNFYIRRGLRIWPLYFGFLLVAFVALRRMVPSGLSPWAYALFLQNFLYTAGIGPVLDPTWSLAVEEQFYLIWPWIALRATRETVLKICCGVLVAAPLLRCAFHFMGASDQFIYVNTFCRLDGIAAGGVLAAWARSPSFDIRQFRRPAILAFLVAGAGITTCYTLAPRHWLFAELRGTSVAIAFAGFVALGLAINNSKRLLARVLRNWSLAGIGRISYALYLFNLPVYSAMHGHAAAAALAHLPAPIIGVVRVASENLLVLALAILSWKIYESPFLKLKSRWAPRRPGNSKPIQQ